MFAAVGSTETPTAQSPGVSACAATELETIAVETSATPASAAINLGYFFTRLFFTLARRLNKKTPVFSGAFFLERRREDLNLRRAFKTLTSLAVRRTRPGYATSPWCSISLAENPAAFKVRYFREPESRCHRGRCRRHSAKAHARRFRH